MQNQKKNYRIFPEINHWWTLSGVRSEFIEKVERVIFPDVIKALNERQIHSPRVDTSPF